MKSKLVIFSVAVLLFFSGYVFASGDHNHESHEDSMHSQEVSSDAINVGNKICPVSGEDITAMGDGKGVQVEHDGKVYNLCCKMCAKDFKKNPEKFIEKINKELEGSEHEDHEQHKGSHHHDHGDHDH